MQILPKEQLIKLLEQTIAVIKEDDSAEGRFEYQWSDKRGELKVDAFIRTGNSMGQGGAIVI